jgi:hypothetical protein
MFATHLNATRFNQTLHVQSSRHQPEKDRYESKKNDEEFLPLKWQKMFDIDFKSHPNFPGELSHMEDPGFLAEET